VLIELSRYVLRLSRYERKEIEKSAISLQRGRFDAKFQAEEVAPSCYFCTGS